MLCVSANKNPNFVGVFHVFFIFFPRFSSFSARHLPLLASLPHELLSSLLPQALLATVHFENSTCNIWKDRNKKKIRRKKRKDRRSWEKNWSVDEVMQLLILWHSGIPGIPLLWLFAVDLGGPWWTILRPCSALCLAGSFPHDTEDHLWCSWILSAARSGAWVTNWCYKMWFLIYSIIYVVWFIVIQCFVWFVCSLTVCAVCVNLRKVQPERCMKSSLFQLFWSCRLCHFSWTQGFLQTILFSVLASFSLSAVLHASELIVAGHGCIHFWGVCHALWRFWFGYIILYHVIYNI